ncbi:hypothetical protein CCMA1212_000939 [Trichoderma ghanense]|uniref:Uncharacterized protein n=1 Tax=Trichoderma ghanense TaxID=65468 RepID=A0ABY2HHR4_9HYPO
MLSRFCRSLEPKQQCEGGGRRAALHTPTATGAAGGWTGTLRGSATGAKATNCCRHEPYDWLRRQGLSTGAPLTGPDRELHALLHVFGDTGSDVPGACTPGTKADHRHVLRRAEATNHPAGIHVRPRRQFP